VRGLEPLHAKDQAEQQQDASRLPKQHFHQLPFVAICPTNPRGHPQFKNTTKPKEMGVKLLDRPHNAVIHRRCGIKIDVDVEISHVQLQ
jgi:hypothetical protein